MEPFFRGPPDLTGHGPLQPSFPSLASSSSSYRPQSADHFARLQRDRPRSHTARPWLGPHPARPSPGSHPPTPPTPLTSPSVLVPSLSGQLLLDPTRKITPPEEKEIHARDEQPVISGEYKSPYDKAFEYIQECKGLRLPCRHLEDYEKPLTIKMSIGEWIKLSRDLDLESKDESFPRFSFNASTSTLIIQCMPSPFHQSIISQLNDGIMTSRATLPVNLRQQTRVLWEQKFNAFGGWWSGSVKEPDLGIQVRNADNEMELKWVFEVGFSETYEQLKSDIQLWLQGSSQVSMVTIAWFCETPRYRCPLPIYDETGEELDPREIAGVPSDFRAIRTKDVVLEGDYGPAIYMGLRWVGQISEVWMETWVRDADTHGKAKQCGNRVDLMHASQVELELGSFLPPGYPQTITINLEEFRLTLQDSIQEIAVVRCRDAIGAYLKRHGEARDDKEYQL